MRSTPGYPLTLTGTIAAVIAGALAAVTSDSLLAGYAVFVLLATTSLVWREGDPPVLPFILAFQWLSVTAGFWYSRWFGTFPGYYPPGDIDRTMLIALSGLVVLAVGARLVSESLRSLSPQAQGPSVEASGGAIIPLFVIVTASYAIDYFYTLNAREFGSLASLIQRVLEFRQVLLVTLWLEIIRARRHTLLLFVSFAWALVPRLGAYYSDFKSPMVLLILVLVGTWRPWDARWWPRSLVAALRAAPLVIGLAIVLLIWQGGLKRDTRLAHDAGEIGADPAGRVSFFVQSLGAELPHLFQNPEPYVEALVERVSYITFFSRVLEHVPAREPHADGELLRMALSNSLVPRFLVPDKADLPSDSYYTRRFAGVQVAEGQTSISIGYMAEFYADWGLGGMFVSIFCYGCWIGLIAAVVRRFTPAPALRFGAMTMVLLAVADFEHQFVKGFAALNLNALITLGLMVMLTPVLRRLFARASSPAREEAPGDPVEASAP
jgi:hypothetical protein